MNMHTSQDKELTFRSVVEDYITWMMSLSVFSNLDLPHKIIIFFTIDEDIDYFSTVLSINVRTILVYFHLGLIFLVLSIITSTKLVMFSPMSV